MSVPGLLDGLELVLGVVFATQIGMQELAERVEGLLDLATRRLLAHVQHLVVVLGAASARRVQSTARSMDDDFRQAHTIHLNSLLLLFRLTILCRRNPTT